MPFKIYRFQLKHRHFPLKYGFLLEGPEGRWSEVSPLAGRSRETSEEALEQLLAYRRGWRGPLLPSVALGLYGLTAPLVSSAPCALLLYGAPETVIAMADQPHGCTYAKLKVGHWRLQQAIDVILTLVSRFYLRIDFNSAWNPTDIRKLCSHLPIDRIEFLEDPGCTIEGFKAASDAEHYPSPISVWKPMVHGLPYAQQSLILSSALESSIGLQAVCALPDTHEIPSHALGVGTLHYIEQDIVKNPAFIKEGSIHFPLTWDVNLNRLFPC